MDHSFFHHVHTRRLPILALAALAIFTASCSLLGEDDEPAVASTSVYFGEGPVDYPLPATIGEFSINSQSSSFAISTTEIGCNGMGQIEEYVDKEEYSFAIQGSDLLVWTGSQCLAGVFHGGDSASLQGTWKQYDTELSPEASSYCSKNYKAPFLSEKTFVINNGQATVTEVWKEFCMIDIYLLSMEFELEAHPFPRPTLTKVDCATFNVSLGSETFQFQWISLVNASFTAKITYKGNSCSIYETDIGWT